MEGTFGDRFGIDTFGIGEDSGKPVTTGYKPLNLFTGLIGSMVVDVR
jgi:arylsulfatase